MAIPKPTAKPDWTSANPSVRTEPTSGKKNTGWNIDERPPREFMNWLFFNIDEWIDYFEQQTDLLQGFDAIVGTGGSATHADLNAVMADGAISAGARIFVRDSATINTVQQLTKNNIEVQFGPGVTYTKGTAARALQLTGTGIRVLGGRFVNFSTVGNHGILVDLVAVNAFLLNPRFNNCDTDISDLSPSSQILAATTE